MDKHLNVGIYEATDAFRSIKQHSCVCFDDMGLVAVTGPAEDKEAQKYADLFSAAPDLLSALTELRDLYSVTTEMTDTYCELCHSHAYKYVDDQGGWTGEVDPINHKPDCIMGHVETAIAKANGKVLEHAND